MEIQEREEIPGQLMPFELMGNYPQKGSAQLTMELSMGETSKRYLQEGAYPGMEWRLVPGHDTVIQRLPCQRAECHFGGRDWVAYYIVSIPLQLGPYKFVGLPGLVVSVRGTEGHHSFTLLGQHSRPMPIYLPLGEKKVTKVSMAEYVKAIRTSQYMQAEEYRRMIQAGEMQVDDPERLYKGANRVNFIERE